MPRILIELVLWIATLTLMEAKHQMTQLAEWASQYRAEIEKQASARAAQLESLLIVGDYQACREFLDMWESDDGFSGSLREKYRQTVTRLQMSRLCTENQTNLND